MALVNPNIAMSFRQPDIQAPNALAQFAQIQQIQGGRQAQELNALKMQEAQAAMEERNALRQLNPAEADYENQLFRVNPTLGIQYRRERSAAEASGAAAKASTAAAAKSEFGLIADRRKFGNDLLRNLSSNPSDENVVAWGQDAVIQNLYPKEYAERTVRQLLAMTPEERKSVAAQAGASSGELAPFVQQINREGQTDLLSVPKFGGAPVTIGAYADVPLPPAVQAQRMQRAAATAPNISVSTEKKFGEVFGGKVAEADVGKLATAEKAPQLAESANRIIDIVQRGDVFTGPIADVKLNIARALNVAGASNQDKIANTEALVAATGQSTLDAIKGAGLGAGQGFTDKDLKFLQGVAGGTINLTAQTLTELATLQHRAASRAAESWNKRSQEIPKEVMRGTGLSTAPITVPPLSKGRAAAGNVVVTPDGQSHTFPTPAAAAQFKKAVGL